MARKTLTKPKQSQRKRNVKLAPHIEDSIKREREALDVKYPDANLPEARAAFGYMDAIVSYEMAQAKVDDSRLDDPDYHVPRKVWDEIERRHKIMLGRFDAWMRMTKHRITVPANEIKNIIVDALKASQDALPDYMKLPGLERHRAFESLSDVLLETLRESGAAVREDEQDVPYCEPCIEELAA